MRELPTSIFQLPSVQRFVGTAVDDLANRRSIAVLLPRGIDSLEVTNALGAELGRRDFDVREVSLIHLSGSQSPAATLSAMITVEWASNDIPWTAVNMMLTDQLPDVILLEDFNQLQPEDCKSWMEFLGQWCDACQTIADRGFTPTALCLVVPAVRMLSQLPRSRMFLSIHWWWGFPSALEIQLLCRSQNAQDEWNILGRWRENIIPAVAVNDCVLVDFLWNDLNSDADTLAKRLSSYALNRRWQAESLMCWGASECVFSSVHDHGSIRLGPPTEFRDLWANGAIGWTLEYGLEIHTAALTLLGRKEEFQHRLWRGQADLLLPFLDQLRLAMCVYLTNILGRDWPIRWVRPPSAEEYSAVRESPLVCQWGHIQALMQDSQFPYPEKRWLRLVSLARLIRNRVAHYRPITLRDFESLCRESKRLA